MMRLSRSGISNSFATQWTVAHQALLMEFSRQETGLPFLLQGIFPTQGLNRCPLLWQVTLHHQATWETPRDDIAG